MTLLEPLLQAEGILFALECARIAGVIIAAPLSWLNAPVRIRGALVLLLAFVIHGLGGRRHVPTDLLEVSWVLVTELTLGIAMGLVIRFVVAMAEVAAEIIAPMLGLSVAHVFDATSHSNQNILTSLLRNVSILIALTIGVHRTVLEALLAGFELIPVGGVAAPPNSLELMCELSSNVLLVGVRLALPLLAILFIVQITLAFVSRAAPQLQVFSVGFAIATAVGLAALILVFPDISRGLIVEYSQVSSQLGRVYGALGVKP